MSRPQRYGGPRLDLGADRRKAGTMQLPCRTRRVRRFSTPETLPWARRNPTWWRWATRPPCPESPEQAVLERVPNPHPDTAYVARFTAPEFTSLCPDDGAAGLRPSRHRLRARALAGRVEVAEALPRLVPQPRRLPRGLHRRHRQAARRRCWSRTACASAATGIRAAASPSTCSGRPARRPRACGCPTRASRPTAGAADRSGRRTLCCRRGAACSRHSRG